MVKSKSLFSWLCRQAFSLSPEEPKNSVSKNYCCVKIESSKSAFGLIFFLSVSELTYVWEKNEGLFQEMKHLMHLQKCNIPVLMGKGSV